MQNRGYETMDGGPGRLSGAARSLAAWYRQQHEEIRVSRQTIKEVLDGGQCSLADARLLLDELDATERDLRAGWAHSSLRRHIESRAEPLAAGGAEQRAGLAFAAGPPAGRSARATDTGARTVAKSIQGYGAVFGRETIIAGVFRERIEAGAFTEALANSDIRCLFNHDSNYLLGRSSAATLECKQDSHGLFFRAYLLAYDGMSYGIARRVDRGDLTGCSFSFSDTTDRWELARKPGQLDLRIIERIGRLYDLGPVVFPAYESTTISASFEELPARSESPAAAPESASDLGVGDTPRPVPAWRQRLMTARLEAAETALREWRVDHVSDCLRELRHWREIAKRRAAHLARYPQDERRIDIPGGLLYAGRW